MKEALKLALEALKDLLDQTETPPDTNCSCHIAPPCNDCVDYSGVRYAIEQANKAIAAGKEALAQPEHSATYQKINLSLLKHSDNCRFWDEGDLCTCGASEFHELQFWKNKALAQPESDPWREAVAQPKIDPWREAVAQPEQEPDYREALRVLSLALEEAPTGLTPKQLGVWQQSKAVLLSGGGQA